MSKSAGTLEKYETPLLCINCIFFKSAIPEECQSPRARYTNFVHGRKDPHYINDDGECPYFEWKKDDMVLMNGDNKLTNPMPGTCGTGGIHV